ncbi:MAG: tetratricopeptide repeat protein [Bacteroidetes bacterium]|nr:tetratricopeptide repeat protein [Bacteroidota bacterium]
MHRFIVRALIAAVCCFSLNPSRLHAQSSDSLTQAAQSLLQAQQWDQAIPLLQQAYEAHPGDVMVYQDLLKALLGRRDYKEAEHLVTRQSKLQQGPTLLIDLGQVYDRAGKKSKAKNQFDEALKAVNGDDIISEQLANRFVLAGRGDYAIQVYEKARGIMQNPFLYAHQLSRLYAQEGDITKAIEALLNDGPTPYGGPDDTQTELLELLGNDAGKLAIAQKILLRHINEKPNSFYYAHLLTWLYTQKEDWEGALIQVSAIDERSNAGGKALLQFAVQADMAGKHEVAKQALDAVVALGPSKPYYSLAKAQGLSMGLRQLSEAPSFTKQEVLVLEKEYEQFFKEFPQFEASQHACDFAELEAQYNDSPAKAISILEHAIAQPGASREFVGRAKLQMGDYQILAGKVWEASLTYSQVDKSFREDFLGEDARFRNARLAYYRGDFAWAQGQLSVLKASTSELIANDALNLSVLITENMPDSNTAPLLLYAHADLLLFQNKYDEALRCLDSISSLYPKHPLQDDVLMLRAQVAKKRHQFQKAIDWLAIIIKDYGQDVLGDDAVFQTAVIYQQYLKNTEQAKHFYEMLLLNYPNSTYSQLARSRLSAMEPQS